MIFLHQHKDIVDIDLHLPDKFSLKDKVVIYILLIPGFTLSPLVLKVQIIALIILQLSVAQHILILKLVK